jgi:hypothetical protein
MYRIPELRKLSEDHHHGLVLARKARRSADEGAACEKTWIEVVEKFQAELEPHFRIEEEFIAPPLATLGETRLVERLEEEHRALRDCIADTAGTFEDRLSRFGGLLDAHIRFEERELFEAVQSLFDERSLRSVEEACRKTSG